MIQDSDLLKPTLSPGLDAPAAIYSVRAACLTSFFGGPVASAMITLVNAHRLRRLARDWPLALLALTVDVMLRWSMSWHALGWLQEVLGGRTETLLREIAGLVFFGAGYALHAPYYRSQSLLDLPTPNGLRIGVLCVLVAIGVDVGLVVILPS
jgi:hypothetical protein